MFPYNVYLCTIPDDFPSVFLHWQDTMEIIYIKKGAGMAQVDLSAFEIHAGDIILIPPGHLHSLSQLRGQRMEYENIIFDMDFLGSSVVDVCSQKYLLPLLNSQLSFPVCITAQDIHSSCLNDADELCDKRPPGFELGVKADIMQLFSLILRYNDTSAPAPEDPLHLERLKLVLNYIEENYLNRYRLESAFKELKNSGKTVLEIAQGSGFDNLSNFNRQFKKQFGITPRELRTK